MISHSNPPGAPSVAGCSVVVVDAASVVVVVAAVDDEVAKVVDVVAKVDDEVAKVVDVVAKVELEVLSAVDVVVWMVDDVVPRGISHKNAYFLVHGTSTHPSSAFITMQFSSRFLLFGSLSAQKSHLPSPSMSGVPEKMPVPSFHEKSSSSVPIATRYPPIQAASVPVAASTLAMSFWSARLWILASWPPAMAQVPAASVHRELYSYRTNSRSSSLWFDLLKGGPSKTGAGVGAKVCPAGVGSGVGSGVGAAVGDAVVGSGPSVVVVSARVVLVV